MFKFLWLNVWFANRMRDNQDPGYPTTIIHTKSMLGRCFCGFYYRYTQVQRKEFHHISSGLTHKVYPLCSLSHPFKEIMVATTFMEIFHNLHGIPKIIVSDRDPIFTRNFWTKIFSYLGTQLTHKSSYHPHFDGKTDILNKFLEG
jgi:hypothetical protein